MSELSVTWGVRALGHSVNLDHFCLRCKGLAAILPSATLSNRPIRAEPLRRPLSWSDVRYGSKADTNPAKTLVGSYAINGQNVWLLGPYALWRLFVATVLRRAAHDYRVDYRRHRSRRLGDFWLAPQAPRLNNPAELARLVVGHLPSECEKFRLAHRGAMVAIWGKVSGEELARAVGLVRGRITRSGYPDHEIVVLNLDQ
jgi:hypothetical protein